MKTCKDCYHQKACQAMLEAQGYSVSESYIGDATRCDTFKDKALVIDLPCEIGRTVFIIGSKYRHGRIEHWINTGKFKLSDIPKLRKTVFLTIEAAEQALKGGAEE